MALEIKNIEVKIEEKKILNGVSLRVDKGEVVALMGPNGSGKSSLAYAIAGHPFYEVTSGEILMDKALITESTPDERARAGLFLAFQYPVGLMGVNVKDLLLASIREREKESNTEKMSAVDIKKMIINSAYELEIKEELIMRDINQGFSGGEKKKMEILQMKILKPNYAILDETDSGLDVDALKTVALGARKMAEENNTGILVITHYKRLLEYLKPDRVLVLEKGKIVREGGRELVSEIEDKGYKLDIKENE